MEQNKKISKEILDLIASNFLTDKDSQFELTDIKKIFSDGLTESDEEISKKEEITSSKVALLSVKKQKIILEQKRKNNIEKVIDYFKSNLHLLNEPINEKKNTFIFKMIDYCTLDKDIKSYQVKHRELFYDFIDYLIGSDDSKINLDHLNESSQTLLNFYMRDRKFEEMLFLLERGAKFDIKYSQKNKYICETTKSYFQNLCSKNDELLKKIQNPCILKLIEKIDYYLDYDIEKAVQETSEIDFSNEKDVLNLKLRVKSYLNLELEKLLEYAGEKRQTFAKAEKNLLKICMIKPKKEFEEYQEENLQIITRRHSL